PNCHMGIEGYQPADRHDAGPRRTAFRIDHRNVRHCRDLRDLQGDAHRSRRSVQPMNEKPQASAQRKVLLEATNIVKVFGSGAGEKQRVALARALAGTPSVILADEPTAALDAENGRAVMALLAEVAKDPNRAVLAVTHDHRTLPYADRIIRIEDGRIHSDERP